MRGGRGTKRGGLKRAPWAVNQPVQPTPILSHRVQQELERVKKHSRETYARLNMFEHDLGNLKTTLDNVSRDVEEMKERMHLGMDKRVEDLEKSILSLKREGKTDGQVGGMLSGLRNELKILGEDLGKEQGKILSDLTELRKDNDSQMKTLKLHLEVNEKEIDILKRSVSKLTEDEAGNKGKASDLTKRVLGMENALEQIRVDYGRKSGVQELLLKELGSSVSELQAKVTERPMSKHATAPYSSSSSSSTTPTTPPSVAAGLNRAELVNELQEYIKEEIGRQIREYVEKDLLFKMSAGRHHVSSRKGEHGKSKGGSSRSPSLVLKVFGDSDAESDTYKDSQKSMVGDEYEDKKELEEDEDEGEGPLSPNENTRSILHEFFPGNAPRDYLNDSSPTLPDLSKSKLKRNLSTGSQESAVSSSSSSSSSSPDSGRKRQGSPNPDKREDAPSKRAKVNITTEQKVGETANEKSVDTQPVVKQRSPLALKEDGGAEVEEILAVVTPPSMPKQQHFTSSSSSTSPTPNALPPAAGTPGSRFLDTKAPLWGVMGDSRQLESEAYMFSFDSSSNGFVSFGEMYSFTRISDKNLWPYLGTHFLCVVSCESRELPSILSLVRKRIHKNMLKQQTNPPGQAFEENLLKQLGRHVHHITPVKSNSVILSRNVPTLGFRLNLHKNGNYYRKITKEFKNQHVKGSKYRCADDGFPRELEVPIQRNAKNNEAFLQCNVFFEGSSLKEKREMSNDETEWKKKVKAVMCRVFIENQS